MHPFIDPTDTSTSALSATQILTLLILVFIGLTVWLFWPKKYKS